MRTKELSGLFLRDEGGVVAIVTALTAVIVMGSAAAAIDFNLTMNVRNDVRHVTKAICMRAASALDRTQDMARAKELSESLGTALIGQTLLSRNQPTFKVNVDPAGSVQVDGAAKVGMSFMQLFRISQLRPTDSMSCSFTPSSPSPSNSNGSNAGGCGGPGGAQLANVAGGSGASSAGFNSNSAGNTGSQSSGNNSRANATGGFSGGNGNTSGGTATSALGTAALSCTNASNGNSSGSSFGFGTSSPGGSSSASSNVTLSPSGGGSSGGGAGFSGPGGGPASGGGGGSFCVGTC